jgi:hypothetical protein
VIIREGQVETLSGGEWKKVGPGGVIFNASNSPHALEERRDDERGLPRDQLEAADKRTSSLKIPCHPGRRRADPGPRGKPQCARSPWVPALRFAAAGMTSFVEA